jgi:hypothetical protein
MKSGQPQLPQLGDLRVWWIPQVPMSKLFYVPVDTVEEGARVVEMLASYDAYQFENRIKPDYSNAGGLQVYEADDDGAPGWSDWYAADGDDFEEYRQTLTLPDFWSWKT